jgi:hypothetical protein
VVAQDLLAERCDELLHGGGRLSLALGLRVGGYTNWSLVGMNAGADDAYITNLGPL